MLEPGSVSARLVGFVDFGPTVLSIAGTGIPDGMQGSPFLGPVQGRPRQYVFAARDRMDETYDRIRAVRDKRFTYIRNNQPEKPYAKRLGYMDQMPTMRGWRPLHAEGRPRDSQRLFFQAKPPEELYDTVADPHEVLNLVAKPEHAATVRRLRGALAGWVRTHGGLGEVPEVRKTANNADGGPLPANPSGADHPSRKRFRRTPSPTSVGVPDTGRVDRLHDRFGSGCSMVTVFGGGRALYALSVAAKAIRYGFIESLESVAELD